MARIALTSGAEVPPSRSEKPVRTASLSLAVPPPGGTLNPVSAESSARESAVVLRRTLIVDAGLTWGTRRCRTRMSFATFTLCGLAVGRSNQGVRTTILIAGTAADVHPIAAVMFDTRVRAIGDAGALIGRLPYSFVGVVFLSGDSDGAIKDYTRMLSEIEPAAVVLPSLGPGRAGLPGDLLLGTGVLLQDGQNSTRIHPLAARAFRDAEEEWLANTQKLVRSGGRGAAVHRGLVSQSGNLVADVVAYQSTVAARAMSLGLGHPVCAFRVVAGGTGPRSRLSEWHLVSFAVSLVSALEGEAHEGDPFATVREC